MPLDQELYLGGDYPPGTKEIMVNPQSYYPPLAVGDTLTINGVEHTINNVVSFFREGYPPAPLYSGSMYEGPQTGGTDTISPWDCVRDVDDNIVIIIKGDPNNPPVEDDDVYTPTVRVPVAGDAVRLGTAPELGIYTYGKYPIKSHQTYVVLNP